MTAVVPHSGDRDERAVSVQFESQVGAGAADLTRLDLDDVPIVQTFGHVELDHGRQFAVPGVLVERAGVEAGPVDGGVGDADLERRPGGCRVDEPLVAEPMRDRLRTGDFPDEAACAHGSPEDWFGGSEKGTIPT